MVSAIKDIEYNLFLNLLVFKAENIKHNLATVAGRQLEHLIYVQKCTIGDSIRVGQLDGKIGTGVILALNETSATLKVTLEKCPPPGIPLTLVLALPRPKMLRRVLQSISSLGVKELYLVNCHRVEKSFWQSPLLKKEAIEEQLILGLEQARDTIMPKVHIRKLFKPFVEDELSGIINGTEAIVAHPNSPEPCPMDLQQPGTLAIGPEGGFISYEVDKLASIGFSQVHLGCRILRVETAVPVLISRLYPA
jgi:16S rRNA (uracil1498-N3)-methyltransferase